MTHKYSIYRPTPVAVAVAAVLGTTAMAGFIAPAHAQEGEVLEEVRVTGSRILRRDLEATSPLVTVGTENFESTGTVALETSLNKLPQFVPSVSQFTTTDVQNTATNTVGASTINLRGLGANRNLVLLDGRRAMPVNASLVVDINSIPAAAIKRVEVISGGASSAYGADAVGGVVNFILKNDFEGMEFDSQYNMTEFGDDQEFKVSALMGGNFSDNRGNAMFGVEYFKRGAARADEREFYTRGWSDPSTGGTEAFFSDTYFQPNATTPVDQSIVNAIFNQAAAGSVSAANNFFFNTDGSIFTATDAEGAYRYNGILDGRFRQTTLQGTIKENQLDQLVSIPSDRYSMFGRADYEIRDNLSMFVQGNFTKNHTRSVLQYSPAVAGWAVSIPRDDASFPIPTELAALLDSRIQADFLGNPILDGSGNTISAADAPWTLNRVLDFLGPRSSVNDAQTYQILAGLNGALPFGDWTWEAYASHGNTEVTNGLIGFASLERYRAIVSAPNYGKDAVLTGNGGAPGNGFAGATVTCTSGLPIFEDFEVSQDCIDAITGSMQNVTKMDQNIAEVNLQGAVVNLPAGELRAAVGTSWRENTFSYQVDMLAGTASFLDGPVGLFPAGSTFGSTEVKEVYAELLVPVLAGLPAIQRLNLELGYRFSDYDTAGSVDTYKALVDWTITDAVRFRGGYQRANRAPNIGELFLPATQAVGGTSFGDPCATNSIAPYGANPNVNPNFAVAQALCSELMGGAAAATFYNPDTQPTGGFFPFVTVTNQGNLNLKSETADTLTAGFVFRPSFETPALRRLTASVDWYQIEIEDTIAAVTFDAIYGQCVNPANNPTQDVNNPFCQLLTRDPTTGLPGQTIGSYQNVGKLKTAGIDLSIDWGADLADLGLASVPGAVSVNLTTTYLDTFQTQEIAGDPVRDYAGTVGGLPLQAGQYRYKTFTTIGYANGGVSGSLRWRHLPSAHAAGYAANPVTPFRGPGHYDIVDLSGNWDISETFQLRFGIENLFDSDPEITNYNPTADLTFDSGQGTTLPGYYDVLGRRYFVGFKTRF